MVGYKILNATSYPTLRFRIGGLYNKTKKKFEAVREKTLDYLIARLYKATTHDTLTLQYRKKKTECVI